MRNIDLDLDPKSSDSVLHWSLTTNSMKKNYFQTTVQGHSLKDEHFLLGKNEDLFFELCYNYYFYSFCIVRTIHGS